MKFPQPIVAQQLSPDRTHIVVGMLNGLLAIRRRDVQSSFCWNLWLPVESRNVWIGGPCGGGRRGHDSARATDEYRLVSLLHAGPCCRGAERRRFAAGFSRPYAAIFGQAPAGAHLAGASSGRKVKLKECLHQRRRFYPSFFLCPQLKRRAGSGDVYLKKFQYRPHERPCPGGRLCLLDATILCVDGRECAGRGGGCREPVDRCGSGGGA